MNILKGKVLHNPIVSVVMPIYKHSKEQLLTAINSILNQTFQDFELIIADGNIHDDNYKIISNISDNRIKYFKITGYINCLNYAIKHARGKYIARMDSDDISYPTRLEEQVKFLENNPNVDLCSCLAEFFGDITKFNKSQHENEINLINLIKRQEIIHPAMMFRKELNIQYDNIKPLEDCLLFRKLLLNGHKISILDKVLFKNYQTNFSIMKTYPKLMEHLMSKINIYALAKYYNYELSFIDNILKKRHFDKCEILEYLKFIKFLKTKNKNNNLDLYRICSPFFCYALSKYEKPIKIFTNTLYFETLFLPFVNTIFKTILQWIFSIKNEYKNTQKTKITCILGIKFVVRI